MICPASPCSSISLVEATLSDNRNSVTNSSIDGNVESSSGSFAESVMINIVIESEILHASRTSSTNVGSGINSVVSTTASPITNRIFELAASFESSHVFSFNSALLFIISAALAKYFFYLDRKMSFNHDYIARREFYVVHIKLRRLFYKPVKLHHRPRPKLQ